MNQDRMTGAAKNLGGQVEEYLSRLRPRPSLSIARTSSPHFMSA